ncbi:hypothetical protein V1638_10115 [Pseudarthrobacter sp. J64]|uniref:alpha/beta fold hydrolase n=1 Tax=Pseudarthrobacter sp. J64 TaxID=3116485 RepID=UPI002E81349C|nr:hypothetical protein [Pseudarthrobacter sp. J64]MEE2569746.1 hypothetical protein [Pseudarthrobacter sp. J64]
MCGPQAAAQPGKQVLGLALICPVVVAEHAERDVPERTVLYRDPAVTGALDAEDARDYAEMAVTESQENWELFRDHALPGLRAFDRRAIGRIAGRQDHVVGYRDAFRLLEHYPRATMSVLDGAGHNAHLDQPDLVHTLLDEWLSRVAASQMSEVSR